MLALSNAPDYFFLTLRSLRPCEKFFCIRQILI